MRFIRVFVIITLATLGVSAFRVGIFNGKAEKRIVPVRADGKPIPTCGPGDPGCIPPGLMR